MEVLPSWRAVARRLGKGWSSPVGSRIGPNERSLRRVKCSAEGSREAIAGQWITLAIGIVLYEVEPITRVNGAALLDERRPLHRSHPCIMKQPSAKDSKCEGAFHISRRTTESKPNRCSTGEAVDRSSIDVDLGSVTRSRDQLTWSLGASPSSRNPAPTRLNPSRSRIAMCERAGCTGSRLFSVSSRA